MGTEIVKKLLSLEGFKIKEMEINEKAIRVHIEPEIEIGICPNCGKPSTKRHDHYWKDVLDSPVGSRKVFLRLKRIRLYCPNCLKPFLMEHNLCGKNKTYTRGYGERIYSRVNSSTIKDVVKEEGLSYGKVARIFKDRRKEREREKNSLPSVLSLDEISVKKKQKFATVVSAPKEKKVLDIISGKSAKNIKETLAQHPKEEREKVAAVIIDRFKPYKNVAEELFPNALVIPDKFHLIREVNLALDSVRKEEQREAKENGVVWGIRFLLMKNGKDLDEGERVRLLDVLKKNRRLRQAYFLKERFRKALAGKFIDFLWWELKAKGSNFEEFRRLVASFLKWHKEIKNYYRFKAYTNGFAEGINNKIKVIKRRAYGFRNGKNFRERVLAACG